MSDKQCCGNSCLGKVGRDSARLDNYYHFPNSMTLASASGLKFSHNNHNKDIDWIFNLNEICISNKNQTKQ